MIRRSPRDYFIYTDSPFRMNAPSQPASSLCGHRQVFAFPKHVGGDFPAASQWRYRLRPLQNLHLAPVVQGTGLGRLAAEGLGWLEWNHPQARFREKGPFHFGETRNVGGFLVQGTSAQLKGTTCHCVDLPLYLLSSARRLMYELSFWNMFNHVNGT